MNKPTFSVILPCYNVAPYLPTCLNSIFLNNMKGNELILINDGSKDSFLQCCNTYFSCKIETDYFESEFNGCKVIIMNQTNHGVSFSRNLGIKTATSDYCLFVDPDDKVSENWLSEISLPLSEYAYDMLIYGYTQETTDAFGSVTSTQIILPLEKYLINKREDAINKLLPKYIGRSAQNFKHWGKKDNSLLDMEHHSVWRIAYNLKFLMKHHLRFHEKIVLNEDGIFNSKCISKATHIATIMQPLYHYHVRPGGAFSQSAREGKKMVDNKLLLLHERIKLLRQLKQEHFKVGFDLISGSTILSIFEMLLNAPDQYTRIKSEYITQPEVLKMIKEIPYIHKLMFDGALFLLKHRCYLLLRFITCLGRPFKRSLGTK